MKSPIAMSCDLPPFEIWLEGADEFVLWENGEYKLKPDAPEWVKKGLKEYNALLNPEPDENGIVTQY